MQRSMSDSSSWEDACEDIPLIKKTVPDGELFLPGEYPDEELEERPIDIFDAQMVPALGGYRTYLSSCPDAWPFTGYREDLEMINQHLIVYRSFLEAALVDPSNYGTEVSGRFFRQPLPWGKYFMVPNPPWGWFTKREHLHARWRRVEEVMEKLIAKVAEKRDEWIGYSGYDFPK